MHPSLAFQRAVSFLIFISIFQAAFRVPISSLQSHLAYSICPLHLDLPPHSGALSWQDEVKQCTLATGCNKPFDWFVLAQ